MRSRSRILVTVLAAVVVFVMLFPFSGTSDQPQRHSSVVGTPVPTDNPLVPLGGAVVAGGVVWVLTASRDRGR